MSVAATLRTTCLDICHASKERGGAKFEASSHKIVASEALDICKKHYSLCGATPQMSHNEPYIPYQATVMPGFV